MLASACANGTGVPQVLLDAKAAEVQKRAEAQKAIEVPPRRQGLCHPGGHCPAALPTTPAASVQRRDIHRKGVSPPEYYC